MKKVTAFLETVTKHELSVKQEIEFNIKFQEGISPVLTSIPSEHNRMTHDDFKQLITATEEHGLKFTFEHGAFSIS